VNVPCGCEARKEIMFDQGKPGVGVALVIGLPVLALAAVLVIKYTGGK
jgi:hypothetical protein